MEIMEVFQFSKTNLFIYLINQSTGFIWPPISYNGSKRLTTIHKIKLKNKSTNQQQKRVQKCRLKLNTKFNSLS